MIICSPNDHTRKQSVESQENFNNIKISDERPITGCGQYQLSFENLLEKE